MMGGRSVEGKGLVSKGVFQHHFTEFKTSHCSSLSRRTFRTCIVVIKHKDFSN